MAEISHLIGIKGSLKDVYAAIKGIPPDRTSELVP
jgi:hypothetical protein